MRGSRRRCGSLKRSGACTSARSAAATGAAAVAVAIVGAFAVAIAVAVAFAFAFVVAVATATVVSLLLSSSPSSPTCPLSYPSDGRKNAPAHALDPTTAEDGLSRCCCLTSSHSSRSRTRARRVVRRCYEMETGLNPPVFPSAIAGLLRRPSNPPTYSGTKGRRPPRGDPKRAGRTAVCTARGVCVRGRVADAPGRGTLPLRDCATALPSGPLKCPTVHLVRVHGKPLTARCSNCKSENA